MQFYIIDVASEIPATGQSFEVQRQFERDEDVVRLSDARNVKTRRRSSNMYPSLHRIFQLSRRLTGVGGYRCSQSNQFFLTTMRRLNKFE